MRLPHWFLNQYEDPGGEESRLAKRAKHGPRAWAAKQFAEKVASNRSAFLGG
jgi:hypothetical protein